MFTLVYIQNRFNRPDTLITFLKSNIGNSPLLQIDCISPYKGTEKELVRDACNYLNTIDPQIEVAYNVTHNISSEEKNGNKLVHFIVIQINVSQKA